ncbi:MAG: iron ABC transporter permease [Treponema sp.]|nr:iron ABC transporter permease [Treponema sp.]
MRTYSEQKKITRIFHNARVSDFSLSHLKKEPALFCALVIIWLCFAVFIFYPLLTLLYTAFFSNGHISIEMLKKNFLNAYTLKALANSLVLATAVSICGTVLGYIFALVVNRTNMPRVLKTLIGAITILPLISPPFTSSISLTLALGPNGTLLKLLGMPNANIYGFVGTWISETLTYFPVAYMVISAILNTMSSNLDDAASSLGAKRARIFRTITVPLSVPAIANSLLLLFGSSLADFATPLILGGHKFPILPTQAYLQITGMFDLKGGSSLSFLLIIPALLVFLFQQALVGKKSYITVSGKSAAQSQFTPLPKLLKIFCYIIALLVMAFVIYLYFIIFAGSFVKVWGIDNTLTLQNYRYVFAHGKKAIADTLKIAAVSTLLGAVLAVVLGYIIQRKEFPAKRVLDFSAMLNYALPGTVVGIAYIAAFNKPPLLLTGTMTILVATYIFRYYATGIRSVIASLQQIDPALEEASASLGANSVRTFTHVTVPLIIPAVLTGMRYLFIHCMTAISATIFLVSARWTLLTTRILESMTELQFPTASAFSVVLIIFVFAADALIALAMKTYTSHFSGKRRT